jgi:Ca-activated chloride channel homolog
MHKNAGFFLISLLILFSSAVSQDRKDIPLFKAEVTQVVIYTSVYNSSSQLVSGLTGDDFQVYEDKVEQEIVSFAQTDIPSSIGIVLDSSGSMRNKIGKVEQALELFLSFDNSQNEMFLIRFDDEVELEEDFTRDIEDIKDSISNVIIKGGTALYDAIHLSAEKVSEGQEPRKILLVFTDGEDKDSYYELEELVDKVEETDCIIFIVAFLDTELSEDKGFFGLFKSKKQKVREDISSLSDSTGGKAFFPKQVEELDPIFRQIAIELKNQYRMSYIPSNEEKNGTWRRINVKVKDAEEKGLKVRAKKGYFSDGDKMPRVRRVEEQ